MILALKACHTQGMLGNGLAVKVPTLPPGGYSEDVQQQYRNGNLIKTQIIS